MDRSQADSDVCVCVLPIVEPLELTHLLGDPIATFCLHISDSNKPGISLCFDGHLLLVVRDDIGVEKTKFKYLSGTQFTKCLHSLLGPPTLC